MKKLDSDRILREIREDIQTKKIDPSALLPFGSIPVLSRDELGEPGREMAELDDSLALVNANWDILPSGPLPGRGIKLFIKKAVRKLVRPSFIRNYEDQRDFNRYAASTLCQLSRYVRRLEARVAELEREAGV
ncbi:MAG: hypothetical protein IJL80_07760 [Treponema sp.]|nr:hypothetical protein [Treponema sp.]